MRSDVEQQIRELTARGEKIEAIKLLREATGVGLAEAKAAIDALEAGKALPALATKPAVPSELPADVRATAEGGDRVLAIKMLRERTGLGLAEAKEWIEAHERGGAPAPLPIFEHPEGRDPNASFTLTTQAIEALKKGNTIEAIKIVRESTGVGLAEAKAIVDEIQRQMPADAPSLAAAGGGRRLSPGEVPKGAGAARWIALVAVAVAIILGAALLVS